MQSSRVAAKVCGPNCKETIADGHGRVKLTWHRRTLHLRVASTTNSKPQHGLASKGASGTDKPPKNVPVLKVYYLILAAPPHRGANRLPPPPSPSGAKACEKKRMLRLPVYHYNPRLHVGHSYSIARCFSVSPSPDPTRHNFPHSRWEQDSGARPCPGGSPETAIAHLSFLPRTLPMATS